MIMRTDAMLTSSIDRQHCFGKRSSFRGLAGVRLGDRPSGSDGGYGPRRSPDPDSCFPHQQDGIAAGSMTGAEPKERFLWLTFGGQRASPQLQ